MTNDDFPDSRNSVFSSQYEETASHRRWIPSTNITNTVPIFVAEANDATQKTFLLR